MINANELRIGNWVDVKNSSAMTYTNEPGITLIETIWHNGINAESSYEGSIEAGYNEENLFGILITPEILEKCGFRKLSSGYRAFKGIRLMPDTESKIYRLYNYGFCEIKYIHQLQNLFFALTGEELKINISEPELST